MDWIIGGATWQNLNFNEKQQKLTRLVIFQLYFILFHYGGSDFRASRDSGRVYSTGKLHLSHFYLIRSHVLFLHFSSFFYALGTLWHRWKIKSKLGKPLLILYEKSWTLLKLADHVIFPYFCKSNLSINSRNSRSLDISKVRLLLLYMCFYFILSNLLVFYYWVFIDQIILYIMHVAFLK